MRGRTLSTRAKQIGILVLLIVSAAQVFWWILDQSRRTRALERRLTSLYEDDVKAATELRRLGTDRATLEALFPELEEDESGRLTIRPEVLESLTRDRARWLNQYGWEGAFFLVVLVVSMGVVWRALRQESLLRRRQQNFMAAVSHELKSPLASLQLSVDTLTLREPPRDRIEQLADRMASDLARMQDMITKMLDTSRLDEPGVDLRLEPVELRVVAHRVARELEARALEAGARLELDIDPTVEILADPEAIETVLRNLLENSLEAIDVGGGGAVHLRAAADRDLIRLTVTDDGMGFEPEEADQLFDKFYRPGDEMRRGGCGQGLGLYIVRRLVELHGGRVAASSPGTGRGARFEVWWPASRESA